MGLQAAQRILGSGDPLALLAEIGQNFPGLVSSLSRQVGPRERSVCIKDRCVHTGFTCPLATLVSSLSRQVGPRSCALRVASGRVCIQGPKCAPATPAGNWG